MTTVRGLKPGMQFKWVMPRNNPIGDRLEFRGSTKKGNASEKFWMVTVEGKATIVHYGKVGTKGQIKRKEFASRAEAVAEANRLLAEKIKKGYEIVTSHGGSMKASWKGKKPSKSSSKKDESWMDEAMKDMADEIFSSRKKRGKAKKGAAKRKKPAAKKGAAKRKKPAAKGAAKKGAAKKPAAKRKAHKRTAKKGAAKKPMKILLGGRYYTINTRRNPSYRNNCCW